MFWNKTETFIGKPEALDVVDRLFTSIFFVPGIVIPYKEEVFIASIMIIDNISNNIGAVSVMVNKTLCKIRSALINFLKDINYLECEYKQVYTKIQNVDCNVLYKEKYNLCAVEFYICRIELPHIKELSTKHKIFVQ